MKNILFSGYSLIIVALLTTSQAYAQKLPEVQQNSLRAPANLKIDGKPTEWNNTFQAYNNTTNISYSLANDDRNLYLVVQTNDADVLTKITNRGVRLVINPSKKKTDKGAISITYPIFELQYNNKPYINFVGNAGGLTHDQRVAMQANPDSMLIVANKKLHNNEKFIRTSGMPAIDTLLSVYNDKDIIAREGFEKGMIYTYELAVPLKYLHLTLSNIPQKFAYHLVFKGIDIIADMGFKTTIGADGRFSISSAKGVALVKKESLPVVTGTTDFWGEYTLAK